MSTNLRFPLLKSFLNSLVKIFWGLKVRININDSMHVPKYTSKKLWKLNWLEFKFAWIRTYFFLFWTNDRPFGIGIYMITACNSVVGTSCYKMVPRSSSSTKFCWFEKLKTSFQFWKISSIIFKYINEYNEQKFQLCQLTWDFLF